MKGWRRTGALVAALFVGLTAPEAAEITEALEPATIAGPFKLSYPEGRLDEPVPFQLVRGVHPVVEVVVNGDTSLRLLVDSGATIVNLPKSVGSPFLKSLCFANGVCFEDMIVAQPDSAYTRDTPGAINGLIGFNVLAALSVTIDYQKRQMVFGQKLSGDAHRIPISVSPEDPRPFGKATVGNRAIERILFDTGSSYVRLKSGVLERLGTDAVPAGGEIAFSISKQEETKLFEISNMCIGDAVCVAGELAQLGSWQAIGATFFRNFRVTIDAGEGVFALVPYATPPVFVSAREKWGFQIALDNAAEIVQVDDHGIAAAAGVSVRDRLVSLDGNAVAELGYLGVHAMLEAADTSAVTLALARGGTSRQVRLTAE